MVTLVRGYPSLSLVRGYILVQRVGSVQQGWFWLVNSSAGAGVSGVLWRCVGVWQRSCPRLRRELWRCGGGELVVVSTGLIEFEDELYLGGSCGLL